MMRYLKKGFVYRRKVGTLRLARESLFLQQLQRWVQSRSLLIFSDMLCDRLVHVSPSWKVRKNNLTTLVCKQYEGLWVNLTKTIC